MDGASSYDADVAIHRGYSLVGSWFEQLARYDLFQCQNHAIFTPYADRGASILDCLDCVLDLEVSTIGGEDRVGQVITCTNRGLGTLSVTSSILRSCGITDHNDALGDVGTKGTGDMECI